MTDKDATDQNMTEDDAAAESTTDQGAADANVSLGDDTLSSTQTDTAPNGGPPDTGAAEDAGPAPEGTGAEPEGAEPLGSATDSPATDGIVDELAPVPETVTDSVKEDGASEIARAPADGPAADHMPADEFAAVSPPPVAQAQVTAGERIAKVMSRAGVASRREAERMIIEGRVTVNGRVIDSPALDVAASDRIAVDGKQIEAAQETRLWLYYKPVGIVTTDSDELGRQTVQDALPRDLPRVMTVGRLDLNSEGLLLLTNDGTLKRVLELPSTGWLRRYRVRVNGTPNDLTLAPLKRGIVIDGEEFAPMEVTIDSSRGANSWLTVGIREGRNREIRRAMAFVNLTVNRLIRIGYGPFKLADMEKNEVREVKRRLLREQLGGLMPGAPEAEAPAPADASRKPRASRRDEEVRPGARPVRAFGGNRGGPRGDDVKPRTRRQEDGVHPQRAPRPGGDARPDRPARKPWAGSGADRPDRGTRPTGGVRTERSAGKPWTTGAKPGTGDQRRAGSGAVSADRPVRGPRPSGDGRSDRKPWDAGAPRQDDGRHEHQKRPPRNEGAADRPVRAPRVGGERGSDHPPQKSWAGDRRRPIHERTASQKDGVSRDGDAATGGRDAVGAARDDRPARKPWDAGGGGPKSGRKGSYGGREEGRTGMAQQRPADAGASKGYAPRPRPTGDAADARGRPDRGKTAWGPGGKGPFGGKPAGPGKPRTRPPGGKPTRGPGNKPSRDR